VASCVAKKRRGPDLSPRRHTLLPLPCFVHHRSIPISPSLPMWALSPCPSFGEGREASSYLIQTPIMMLLSSSMDPPSAFPKMDPLPLSPVSLQTTATSAMVLLWSTAAASGTRRMPLELQNSEDQFLKCGASHAAGRHHRRCKLSLRDNEGLHVRCRRCQCYKARCRMLPAVAVLATSYGQRCCIARHRCGGCFV
jgi:hypothetical protein